MGNYDPRNLPGNYTPISVLPAISNVFERIVYNQLNGYLTKTNYFLNINLIFADCTLQHQPYLIVQIAGT